MKNTTVRCPKCGASFMIPDHEHTQCGVVIGKDSKLGTVYLKTDDEEPCMPKRGPDGKFLPRGCKAEGYRSDAYKDLGDAGRKLSDEIREGGEYVKNHRLFRRWIMGQLFHILRDEKSYKGYTERLRWRGVRYMWKVTKNEIHDAYVIKRNGDLEEFDRRNRWFSKMLVKNLAEDFEKQLVKVSERLPKHKCKGREYVRFPGFGNCFCDEVKTRILRPIECMIDDIHLNDDSTIGVEKLCDFLARFKEGRYANLKMPVDFVNAFKANGSYFTLRNMLMFHGCTLPDKVVKEFGASSVGLKGIKKQLSILDNVARYNESQGWQLLGLLRDTISFNGIDVDKKIKSWQK